MIEVMGDLPSDPENFREYKITIGVFYWFDKYIGFRFSIGLQKGHVIERWAARRAQKNA